MVARHEIDSPFRFTWDFCSALVSLFATFLIYGPVLLVRQVIRSGSRGWFVARVFLSVLVLLLVAAGVFYFTGYTPERGHVFGFVAGFGSIAFLHWRLERAR